MSEFYKFNQNEKCEYFPCHKGVKTEEFNCLFCYCPLYMLGEDCGGNYSYTHGIKDCSKCNMPHHKDNYNTILRKMNLVFERTKK